MRRLRQKIEVDPNRPRHLLTMRGIGYRLVATEEGGNGSTPTPSPDANGGDA